MNRKTLTTIFSSTMCLLVICIVVTFAVAGTRHAFKEKIAEQEWLQTQKTMSQLLKADSYQEVPLEEATVYQALDSSGNSKGYLLITEAYGYGSNVSVMSAITDGQLIGIQILDCANETPGLGQNIAKEKFTKQFNDLASLPVLVKTEPVTDDQVQAVTGATKSSNAVIQAVEAAMSLYDELEAASINS